MPTPALSLALAALPLLAVSPGPPPEADREPPLRDYWAYVAAESEDEVALVRFGPQGAEVARTIQVGTFPAEIEGPHGINVSPSGRFWYVSISHGMPFGTVHKYATGTDEWEGDVTVGMFPATLDVAGTTGLLYVVNSDFFGDHRPSTISVVETSTMTEVRQIPTGTMPHGARLSRDGKRLYSVNMMDDELVEVDALRFEISRRLALGAAGGHDRHGAHGATGATGATGAAARVEPSWVSAPTADGKLYVTALSGNQIVEVDVDAFEVTRRFDTVAGPYNLAVTPDQAMLVVTYKKSDAVGFWDLSTGIEIARVATTRRIPHGVAVTSDGRYSFVTVEGVGGEPGVVEVYDNRVQERVATIEVGKQAGGVAVWERGV
jgi:DNA-binding beta-propeller fold protein YncE